MNNHTLKELQKCAEQNAYFWNGLFAVIYEERRYEIPIGALTAGEVEDYWIYESISTIKNYLSCKKVLDFPRFEEFCNGIHCNILDKRLTEVVSYINRAYAYLEEQEFSKGKISKSKKYRQNYLGKVDSYEDDTIMWEQQILQEEREYKQIIEEFSDLTKEELSMLYQVADGYIFFQGCDDFFMERFPRLTEYGQALFKEALEVESKRYQSCNRDETCKFCDRMVALTDEEILDITPDMLYEKLLKISFCTPEDAKKLKQYRYANANVWRVLELYHSVMCTYSDENIEDLPFGDKDCLLILLNWLVDIPSLRAEQ